SDETSYLIFGTANLSGDLMLSDVLAQTQAITLPDGQFVALGDVNHDGFDDLGALAVLSRPGINGDNVTHLVGEVFWGAARSSIPSSGWAPGLVIEPTDPQYGTFSLQSLQNTIFNSVGDANGDAIPDFAYADTVTDTVQIFYGHALQAPSGNPTTLLPQQ